MKEIRVSLTVKQVQELLEDGGPLPEIIKLDKNGIYQCVLRTGEKEKNRQ